jgi:hypothetical protein
MLQNIFFCKYLYVSDIFLFPAFVAEIPFKNKKSIIWMRNNKKLTLKIGL